MSEVVKRLFFFLILAFGMVINLITEMDSSSHFPFQLSKATSPCEPKAFCSVGFIRAHEVIGVGQLLLPHFM